MGQGRGGFLVEVVYKLRSGAWAEITLKQGIDGEWSVSGTGNNVHKGPEAKRARSWEKYCDSVGSDFKDAKLTWDVSK